jgi:ribosomal protein L7/L12
LQAITLDHRYAARLPFDSEFLRNAAGINPAWIQYAKDLWDSITAAKIMAIAAMQELSKSQEETNRMRNSHAFELLDFAGSGLAEAKARFQKMTELMNTLSPEAEKSLKVLKDKLQENSVFALLEAEPEAQRANDLMTGALAASREAEFTLRKVEQLSHGLPDSFPIPFSTIFSALKVNAVFLFFGVFWCLLMSGAIIGGIFKAKDTGDPLGKIIGSIVAGLILVVPPLIWFVVSCRGFIRKGKEEAMKKGIESFDWSAANRPQTTAETNGTILRANQALRRSVKPDHPDEMDPDSLEGQLVSFLRNGEKIKAIALYRQETGCDLLTGKSYVESLAFEHDIF